MSEVRATDNGDYPHFSVDALGEVKSVADAAQQPAESGFLRAVRRTLRTLRGFAGELESVPKIAEQFMGYVDKIGELITG